MFRHRSMVIKKKKKKKKKKKGSQRSSQVKSSQVAPVNQSKSSRVKSSQVTINQVKFQENSQVKSSRTSQVNAGQVKIRPRSGRVESRWTRPRSAPSPQARARSDEQATCHLGQVEARTRQEVMTRTAGASIRVISINLVQQAKFNRASQCRWRW